MSKTKTIRTDYLARVEGEGGMLVRMRERQGRGRQASDLRAASVLRSVPPRTPLHGGAGHHRAHLRHLPGRVPDGRVPRDGVARRRRGGRAAARPPPPPLLRRVDRVAHAPRLHAACARLPRSRERGGARADEPGDRRAGAADEEDRQRGHARRRRPRGPSDQRARRRVVPDTDESAARGARPGPRVGARAVEGDGPARLDARLPDARAWTTEFVALDADGEYPIDRGSRLVSDRGLDIPLSEFYDHVQEEHVEHSNALHARLRERGNYLVGPCARHALHRELLSPQALAAADEVGLEPVVRNPFRSIIVRAVELVHACDEALRLIAEYEEPAAPAIEVVPKAGFGHGASEAPRGVLYHRYRLDDAGLDPRREDRAADLAEPEVDRG